MRKLPQIAMFRSLLVLVSVLLLSACAGTSSYHRGYGGGDYYYGAANDSYYARQPARLCERSIRYGYYGSYRCHRLTWEPVGAWPYPGWTGWGYPYYGSQSPWYGGYGGWSGSLWLSMGNWGYPGYRNPWFSPWWPYSVVYPVQRHSIRDRQRLHREQALQAAWQRHVPARSAASVGAAERYSYRRPGVVQRQRADVRRRNGLIGSWSGAATPSRVHRPTDAVPAQPRGMPRDRSRNRDGTADRWPSNRARLPDPITRNRPRARPDAAEISTRSVRTVPVGNRSMPRRVSHPDAAPALHPVTRPQRRSRPPMTQARPAPVSRKPAAVRRTPARTSAPMPVTRMPRGRPDKPRRHK